MNMFSRLKSIMLSSIVLVCGFCTVAYGQDKNVCFSKGNMKLGVAFTEIEGQTYLTVAYNEVTVDLDMIVKAPTSPVPLSEALDMILESSGNTFIIKGKQIVITEKMPADRSSAKFHTPEPLRMTQGDL